MTREVTKRISIFHTEAQNLMKQKQYRDAVVLYLNSLLMDKENTETFINISKAYKRLKE